MEHYTLPYPLRCKNPEEMTKEHILSIIRQEVEKKNLRKNAIAKGAGINYVHLLRILDGTSSPSIDKVIALLNELDLELLVIHK